MYLYLPFLSALLLLSGPPPPRLTVTPRTGIGPLPVRVQTRTVPVADDRLIELVALEDAEPPIVVCRSQAAVRHDGRSQFVNAEWTLPAGAYVIVACVYGVRGSGRCAEQALTVR